MATQNRIDVHQHVVPPFWAKALQQNGGDPSGWDCPQWSPESTLNFMDSQQISTGILSLTAPGVTGWKPEERCGMARDVNDYMADLVAQKPNRFGNFATLPLPNIEDSLAEIERAFDVLKADGIILLSNYEGIYLGDEVFEPIWRELDRRSAVVFIHPGKPELPLIKGIPGPIVDYPFDTTRSAVHIVFNGVMNRYKSMKVILSHAGGFLPYASHRFAEAGALVQHNKVTVDEMLKAFQSFYFDTALSASPAALPALKAFCGTKNILYGSDYPYAPASIGAPFTKKLDEYADFSVSDHSAINRGNALKLFPRLAKFS